jgi:hypothetical protein
MHMLGLYFHSDKGLLDMWAKVRMEGVDLYLLQQAKLLLESLWKEITNECRALQELDEGYYQKAFLDQLAGKIWADPQRSHDPLVLNWVATALDFDKLITCFGAPVDKMTNAIGEQAVVCKERMDLQQAKQTWESYWQGQINLKDIFQAHGNKVCMVAPERMDCLPTLVSKLQRDLMKLHTTTVFDNTGTATSRDWKFGLLINVPKCPVSPDGKSEDIALGLNFVKTEWLEMPLWPFH